MDEVLRVDREDDGKIYTHLNMNCGYSYRAYGLLVADILRHISNGFNVPVDYVIEWVNKELSHPTTDIKKVETQ